MLQILQKAAVDSYDYRLAVFASRLVIIRFNHCSHLTTTAFAIIFSRELHHPPPTCFSSFGKIPASVDATEGGTVDTEMRRFLKVLSEPATFRINNNNSTQRRAKARKREREGRRRRRRRKAREQGVIWLRAKDEDNF